MTKIYIQKRNRKLFRRTLHENNKWCTIKKYANIDDANKGFDAHTKKMRFREQFRMVSEDGVIIKEFYEE